MVRSETGEIGAELLTFMCGAGLGAQGHAE